MINDKPAQPLLDGPIPGQALTAGLGDRPWQQPARYATPDEALTYYVQRLTQPELANKLFDILEMGVPVDEIVDGLQLTSVMEGIHSIDVGVILAPAIAETITQLAKSAGVEYVGMGTPENKDRLSDTEVALALKKSRDKLPEVDELIEDTMELPEEEAPAGLMSRRM